MACTKLVHLYCFFTIFVYLCNVITKKNKTMITVSSREFRSKQKSYLDQVAQGIELLVTRKNESFKVIKVTEDDTLMSKEAFFARIERAIADVKEGKTYTMKPNESLDDFLNRMEVEGHV